MVRLKDIARAAGVTSATASTALSGRGRVSADMRERIRKLAREMNYEPDLAALLLKKKNIIFRHIPHLLKTEKNVNQYLLETFSDIHYTYPNIYDQKIRNISSTLRNQNNIPGISEYLHANIYAPYMVNNKLLSPLVATSNRHYYYRLDSICITVSGKVLYHISFEPKYKNQQLVSGHCIVDAENWVVRDFYFEGQSDLLHFKCHIEMGKEGSIEEFLPKRYDLTPSSNAISGNHPQKQAAFQKEKL